MLQKACAKKASFIVIACGNLSRSRKAQWLVAQDGHFLSISTNNKNVGRDRPLPVAQAHKAGLWKLVCVYQQIELVHSCPGNESVLFPSDIQRVCSRILSQDIQGLGPGYAKAVALPLRVLPKTTVCAHPFSAVYFHDVARRKA